MFSIEVTDNGVQSALNQLAGRVSNMQPVLQSIGEDIQARAKARFGTSTGPDGVRWKANARSTIEAFIGKRGGFGKKGINAKGQALAISKKPLIGHSRDLAREFHVNSDAQSVTIGNTMIYAAIQQFGGTKSKFPNLWGDIPARPFLPITQGGDLYPEERSRILETINEYLAGK